MTSLEQGAALGTESFNNGFANLIVRRNQERDKINNQKLKLSGQAVSVCSSYSLSNALNNMTCDALSNVSDSTETYIKQFTHPYMIGNNISKDNITDITTVAQTTAPALLSKNSYEKKASNLQQQAFDASVYAALSSIKQDKLNIYNPLTNSALDDFSDKEIKKIQTQYSESQILRKMAIMKAKQLAAMMLQYKDELNREYILAQRLTLKIKQFGRVI